MKGAALNTRDPDLVALAEGAGNGARQAAIAAARIALERSPVSNPPVAKALAALARSDTSAAIGVRPELEALLKHLDGLYWDVSDPSKDAAAVYEAFAQRVPSMPSSLHWP
jgi:hypothetical protein